LYAKSLGQKKKHQTTVRNNGIASQFETMAAWRLGKSEWPTRSCANWMRGFMPMLLVRDPKDKAKVAITICGSGLCAKLTMSMILTRFLDRAETLNQEHVEPMQQTEVTKIAKSAWGYTERGENRFGQHGAWFPEAEVDLLVTEQDAFILLAYLRAKQGPDSTFMIANGLSGTFGWGRQRLSAARELLIQRGYVRRLRHATNNSPALYRWLSPKQRNEVLVENRCLQMDTLTLAEMREAVGYRQ
jgi:hypothetical protein